MDERVLIESTRFQSVSVRVLVESIDDLALSAIVQAPDARVHRESTREQEMFVRVHVESIDDFDMNMRVQALDTRVHTLDTRVHVLPGLCPCDFGHFEEKRRNPVTRSRLVALQSVKAKKRRWTGRDVDVPDPEQPCPGDRIRSPFPGGNARRGSRPLTKGGD